MERIVGSIYLSEKLQVSYARTATLSFLVPTQSVKAQRSKTTPSFLPSVSLSLFLRRRRSLTLAWGILKRKTLKGKEIVSARWGMKDEGRPRAETKRQDILTDKTDIQTDWLFCLPFLSGGRGGEAAYRHPTWNGSLYNKRECIQQ